MIKVVHIARPYAGIEMYLRTIFAHIDSMKVENYLLCDFDAAGKIFVNNSGMEIPQINIDLRREINPIRDFKCINNLLKIIKEINPEVIHCHSAKAGILGRIVGKRLRIKTFYTPHAFSYLSAKNSLIRQFYKSIEKSFRNYPSKIIACSTSEVNRALVDLNYARKNVLLWNNSINDIGEVKSSSSRVNLPTNYICCVGRSDNQKNLDLLIKVMSFVKQMQPGLKLILIGIDQGTVSFQRLREKIRDYKLKDSVIIYPWVNRDEVFTIVKSSLIYVSTSKYEGLPYAVIEALALSKPCVLTAVDGHLDLVKNNHNGFLIEKMNAKAMAEKIFHLVQNEEKLLQFGRNSRLTFLNEFHIENNIAKLENYYHENTI